MLFGDLHFGVSGSYRSGKFSCLARQSELYAPGRVDLARLDTDRQAVLVWRLLVKAFLAGLAALPSKTGLSSQYPLVTCGARTYTGVYVGFYDTFRLGIEHV